MKRTGLFLALVSVLAISILSCDVEIGLGASVDTRAPELTIQNPPAGSVIRDVFAMSGTCGDDGTIASISVELKHTESGEVLPAFEGTFNQKEGTWFCEINPLDEKTPVPDGSYEATVTIKDGSERETIRTRAYTIDNTAPVLAITRPSSVIPTGTDTEKYPATDYDSYGQDLIIEGHVADTCERRFISVDVYDKETNELKYSTLSASNDESKRIKIDSDFSTTIASWKENGTEEVNIAYKAIYGDNKNAGTKEFYCKITVYDDSRKYPLDISSIVPEDLLGNSTDCFYLYDGDLYSSVFDIYGMTNSYKLLNGSYSGDSRTLQTTPEDAKSYLEDEAYKETMGFLSLNPENNPYFKVSGHEAFDKAAMENGTIFDDTEHHITNNSTVVVEVYPGLDQTPLVQDNLGLYLIPADFYGNPIDAGGNVVSEEKASKIWLVRPLVDENGNAIITDAEEINTRKTQISKIGSTYKFTVYLTTQKDTPDGSMLVSGNKYLFGVQGWDKKSVAVKNADSILGFKLVESGTAPSLTVKSVTPKWITTNQNTAEKPEVISQDAAKKVSVDLAFSGDAPFRLTRIVNETEENAVEEVILSAGDLYRESEYIDEYTPPAGAGSGKIKYILTGNNDLSCTEEVSFYVDNQKPTVVDYSIPSVQETGNNSYKFTGIVEDGDANTNSKIANVQIRLSDIASLDTENPIISKWLSVDTTDRWNHTVVFDEDEDLSGIFVEKDSAGNIVRTLEGLKQIEIRAIDAAGNISDVSRGIFVYDRDEPKITVRNYKMGNNAAQTIKNEFFVSEKFSLSGTAEDSYGLESVTVKQIKGQGDDAVAIEVAAELNDEGEWIIENLPRNTLEGRTDEPLVETGVYKYSVTVIDKTGVKKAVSSAYTVRIDQEAPVVTITSPDSNIIEGTNFLFKGTLTDEDGTGVSGYSYKFVKSDVTEASVEWTDVTTASNSWSFYKELASGNTVTGDKLCEGEWNLYVKANDGAGNESSPVVRQFTVDTAYPEVTETGIGTAGSTVRSGITLSGTTSDSYGVESVIITDSANSASSWTIPRSSMTDASTAGTYNWSQAIQLGTEANKLSDGNHTLIITAIDKAGKQKRIERSVIVDTTAPVINTVTMPSSTETEESYYQFSGTVEDPLSSASSGADSVSGIDKVYVKFSDGTNASVGTDWIEASGTTRWNLLVTYANNTYSSVFSTEGPKSIFVKAIDKAGNVSEITEESFVYDKAQPAGSVASYTVGTTNISLSGVSQFDVSNVFSLSGTATDSYKLKNIQIIQRKNNEDEVVIASIDASTESQPWTVQNLPRAEDSVGLTGTANITEDAVYRYAVKVYDDSSSEGKVYQTSWLTVRIDTTAPVVTVSSPSTNLSVSQSIGGQSYTFSGNVSDTGVGLEKYQYAFTKTFSAPAASAWTTVTTAESGLWNIEKTLISGTQTSNLGLSEGLWYFWIKASDTAGNESTPISRSFYIDINAPSLNSQITTGSNCVNQSGVYYFKGALSGTASASDTNALNRIEYKLGDTVITPTSNEANWTIPVASFTSGVNNTLTITAYDYVGKQTVNTYQVYSDTSAPTVNVATSALSEGDIISRFPLTIYGTADDGTGIGTDTIYYSLDGSEPSNAISVSGSSWTKEITGSGIAEGTINLKLKIKDKLGNESGVSTISFYYDIADPVVTETGIGTAGSTVRSDITLSGTAGDSNQLVSVVITDSVNSASSWTIPRSSMTAASTAGNYNWSQIIQLGTETNKLSDGNHTLSITAIDVAGKQTKLTRSVVVDTAAPDILTITSPATNDTAAGEDSISGSSYNFTGNATDNISGLASYSYVFSQSSTAPTTGWSTVTAENGNWTINRSISSTTQAADGCLHEGEWYLFIKAKDKAGNETQTPVTRHFWVDQSAPALTNVSIAAGEGTGTYFFRTDSLTLSGNAIDTHGLADNAVVIKKAGTAVATITRANVGTDGSWQVTLDEDLIPNDGSSVAVTIEVTDLVGKTSGVKTYNVNKDQLLPVIAVTGDTPATNADLTYQKSVNFEFTGTAVDANLDEVKAELYKNGTKIDQTTLTTNETTNAWKWKVYDLEEETYYIKVFAKDKAGNTSDYQTGSIRIDKTAPKTNINGTALYASNGTTSVSQISNGETVEAGTYYAKTSYTISGTVTDNNLDYSTGFVLKENGTEKTVTFTDSGWTYTPTSVTDNSYPYTITVTDKAQNNTTYSFTVVYDTTAPIITVTAPTSNQAFEGTGNVLTLTASGAVNETGIGLVAESFKYTTDDSGNATSPAPAANATWHSFSTYSGGSFWSQELTFNAEGAINLYIKAEDKLGNVTTTPQHVRFSFDKQVPQLAKTHGTLATYYKLDDNIVLRGTAYDSNKLIKLEITDTVDSNSTTYSTANNGEITVTGTIASAKDSESAVTWSKTLSANSLTDGYHTIKIIATDDAGRTNTITEAFTVDTTPPTISADDITTPTVSDTEVSTFTFRGTVGDPLGSGASQTSGIKTVKIKYSDGTNTSAERTAGGGASWFDAVTFNEITKSGVTYSQSTPAADKIFGASGVKTIFVEVEDNAGNKSAWISKNFNYDKASPTIALASYAQATNNAAPYSYGATTTQTSDFAVGKVFKMSGTVNDDWGMAESNPIVIKQKKGTDGTEVTLTGLSYNAAAKTWTIEGLPRNPAAAETTALDTEEYTYSVTVTDLAGKQTSKNIRVTVDNTAPVVEFNNPENNLAATAYLSGSTYNFAGTANDTGTGNVGLASYSYAFTQSAATPGSWTTVNATDGNWTINRTLVGETDTTSLAANEICEGQWYLHFKAKDKAGNETADAYRSFYVDLSAPRLTASVTTAENSCISQSGTYYFKGNLTGTATATDDYAMATSAPITFKVGTTPVTPTWNGTTWTIATSAFDETYQTLTITAKDFVGRTTSETYNIYKDVTAPQVSIIRPEANGNIDTNTINARFSVIENGVGIQGKVGTAGQSGYVPSKVEYRLNSNSDDAWIATVYTSGTTIDQTLDLGTDVAQGPMTLEVRATDKLGNTYTTPATTFYYDYQDPVIVETDNVARYVNEAFTLTGTAYDTYSLSYIEVKDTTAGNKVYRSNSTTNTQITYTGNITAAKTEQSKTIWTLAFTEADWIGFTEGNHVFKITAYDVSGRSAEAPNKNIWIDKHAPVVTSATVPTTAQTQGATFRFSGIAKDYNNNAGTANSTTLDSGIKNIEIQITNSDVAATASGWIEATGQEDWSAVVAYDDYDVFDTEGIKTLHVRATDESGLTSTVFTKNFVYDKAAPTLAVSSYTPQGGSALSISSTDNEPTFNVNGNFALSGTSSDSNGVKDIKIYQKIGTGNEVLLQTLSGNQTATWSITGLPRSVSSTSTTLTGDSLDSGTYTYRVVVTDNAGVTDITESTAKTAEKTVKATIDKTPPSVAISDSANENANTGLNAISVVSNRFAGTASDNHEGTTNVGAVWYKIIARDGAVPTAPTANTTVDGSWTTLGFAKASNTDSWSFTQAFKEKYNANGTLNTSGDGMAEGRYRLVVYAVDNAGNVSTNPATKYFDVDMNAPAIETRLDGNLLDESMTQTKTGAYTFKYKVTETYGLAANNPVVTMKKDNADFTGFTQSAADAENYVTVSITSQADGLYEYTISATDLVGKNYTIRRNILLDTTPPTLTVTSPDLSGYQNTTSVKINGSSEDKSGTETVWYSFGAASMPAIPTSATTTDSSWTGWTKASGTTSWSFTVTGVEGTDKNLYIAAVDTNGAVTTNAISKVVKVDVTNPTLTETGIGAGIQYKNAAFTLTGTASDSGSGLAATNPVTISDETNTYTPTFDGSTWSTTITPASDGTYTYTIKATDKAGRDSSLSRTVVYDTTPPQVGTTKTIGTVGDGLKQTIDNVDWYKTTQIPVIISGSDVTAGVQTIECSTDHSSWNTLTPSGNNYTGTISCTSQGENTIYIRVTDNSGNKNTDNVDWDNVTASWLVVNTLTVHVDTTAPELTATSYSYDGGTAASITDSVHVNGSKTLTVSGTYSDTGVGVDSLTFKIGNTTITPTVTSSGNTWTTTFTPTVGGQLSIKGKDKLNNASQEVTPFTIIYDNTAPTISNISLNGAYKPSASAETYYTNNTNTEFKFMGVAADNTGVESVSVVIKDSTDTVTTITPVLNADGNGSLNNWNFTLADDTNKNAWKALATSATAVVKVTDKAKNEATSTVTINFDVDSPYSIHELDASTPNAKDLYFRIGNQNRDDGATTTNGVTTWNPEWSSTLDEDVGGKYSHGTFGNETSIEIRGRFDDNGSGVKNIYYKVYGTDQTGTALNTIKADVLAAPDGVFSLKEDDTKRVFYKKSDGSRDNKEITTNFREKLIGFAEGENYLVLVAVDNVGNAAVDSVVVDDTTYPNYSINVDRTAPTLTSNTTETLYTNAASGKTIALSGTVSDGTDGAGIDKVVIIHPINQDELPATVTGNNWSCSLDATILAGATGTTSIYAKAYDKAGSGNWTKVEVARVVVDTTAPTIELADPDDADNVTGIQINGIIKLTGTAGDTIGTTSSNKFEVTSIEYRMTKNAAGTAVTNDWAEIDTTLMSEFAIASSESFVVNGFDTTNLTDKATYELRAVVKDSAGNTTESEPVTVVVDQDTDRPVITLSNIALPASGTPYLKSTKTLYLSVSDDDGVSFVKYKVDDASDWTHLSGSSITINGNDGEHTINFQVTDKKGTTFDSTSTTGPTPKITDGDSSTVRSGTLSINIVTQKPTVTNILYSVYDAQKVLLANQTDADRWSAWSNDAGTLSYLRFNKFKIKFNASSVQGINSAAVATTALNGAANAISFTCDDSNHNDADGHIWTSGEIGIVNSINGTKEISLSVEDNAEMVYEQTLSITVDNTSPIISISQPSTLIGQEETIRGDITGDNHVTLYYAVSRYCAMNEDGTPNESSVYADSAVQPNSHTASRVENGVTLATKWIQLEQEDTGLKWYVYFDGKSGVDHTAKLGTYLTESYLGITTADEIADTSNPYDSRTPVYFWIKAVDDYGNEAVEKQKLNIDPQGERPIVVITYPTNTVDTNGNLTTTPPTLGGTIRMTGTATDNNSAKYAWIQVDFDGKTGFSQDELTYLKNKGYTLGKISTNTKYTNAASVPTNLGTGANAAADYGIVVDVKGSGWNQTLNSASEFNQSELVTANIIEASTDGTSTLKITVYATDADTTPHKSLPATQTVIIDSNRPYVEQSSLELVQYGDTPINGEYPIIARKPYSSGTRISEIWYLIGNIKDDDSGIGEIKHNNSVKITNTLNGTHNASFTDTNDHNYWFKPVSATVTESGQTKTIYNYKFSIPLGSDDDDVVGTSTSSFAIKELTTTGLEAEAEHSVTYDNKAPELRTDNSYSALIRLERNVQNSNGFYSFGAIASEDDVDDVKQSGVERIAFYFTRDMNYSLYTNDNTIYSQHSQAQTHDLFDVMISHENTSDTTDVNSGNMIIDYNNQTTSGLVLQKGLYWKSKTGNISGNTVTLTAADKNIHKKGLAMVNGTVYLINDLSADGKDITLDAQPGNANGATVYFAICNVIDNGGEKNRGSVSTTSGYGFGYYPTRDNDDGDLITESFASQGSDWIFDASINSKNLPDGPITLHMVAFDKAGNYAEWASATTPASEETFVDKDFVVSNNAPRIAGMRIGTDENGSGEVEDTNAYSEFVGTWSDLYALGYHPDTSEEMRDVTFPTQTAGIAIKSARTIKGLTIIKPELVGGNGKISYNYSVYKHTGAQLTDHTFADTAEYVHSATTEIATGTTNAVATLTANITLPVSDFIGTSNGQDTGNLADNDESKNGISDGIKKFVFNFGDSTPGKNADDVVTNNAALNVIMDVALRETNAAKNWILPFYWNSKDDNSLFKQSSAEGHIELAKDWVTTTSYRPYTENDTVDTIHLYDQDPKVSGKIKIEGIAKDDTLLRDIKVKLGTAMTTTGGIGTTDETATTIASYDYDTGTWGIRSGTGNSQTVTAFGNSEPTTIPAAGWVSYVKQATYQDLLDTKIITALPVGSDNVPKKATDEVPYTSQDYGHVVHWILYLDTSKITGVAATNVTVTATATDRGTPKWNTSANNGNGGAEYTANAAAVTTTASNTGFSGAVTLSEETPIIADLTGSYRMDVVPYITKLYTGISDTAGEEFARSATGKYIVRGKYRTKNANGTWNDNATETVRLFGFNLEADSTTGNVTIGSTNKIKTTASSAADTTKYGSHLTFPVGTGTSSGKLSIAVNSITSLNNINASPEIEDGATEVTEGSVAMYNSQANGKTNNRLTDDVELWVWNMGYYLNEVSIWNPMLAIDKKGQFYMSYGYGPANMYVKKGTGNTSEVSVDYSYNKFINTGVTYDSNGNIYAIATNTDRIHDESAKVTLYMAYDNRYWYPKEVTTNARSYQVNSDSKHLLEHVYNDATGKYDTDRVKNPSISTYTSGNDTKVAIAYYDNNHTKSPVKFRFGTRSKQNNSNAISFSGGIEGFTGTARGNTDRPTDDLSEGYSAPDTGSGSASGYHVIASSETTIHGGPYTSVGIVPVTNGYVGVVAWYDASTRSLYFSYNETPGTAVIGGAWQTNAVCLDDDYAGWYVQLAVDSDKGIHIAYYKSSTGDLKYAYIPDYTAITKDATTKKVISGATVVTVDSYLSVGTNLSIDVRKEGDNQVPYINYYNSSNNKTCNSVKVAWRKDFTEPTEPRDGAIDDKFTGAWESMTIPSVNIPSDATVCGGVPSASTTTADNKTVFLGYMSDVYYEKATINGDVTQ